MKGKLSAYAYLSFLPWGILSALGITVSTFIDAVLVGNLVGSEGLAVVSIATPVFLFYALLGMTLGCGANVLIGKRLGASETDGAVRLFSLQVELGVFLGIVAAAAAMCFRKELLTLLGAKGELFALGSSYLTVVFLSAPIFVLYHILAASLRTDGDPKLVTLSSLVVIVTDLGLDLLFMGALRMGVFGASLSLCIAELLGTGVLLFHFIRRKALLRFRFVLPSWREAVEILKNGFGVGSAYIFQAVVMLAFNLLLVAGGTSAGIANVAAFGVIYTMSTVPYAVFEGTGGAVLPTVSIFSGERDGKSVMEVLRLSIAFACLAGLLMTGAFLPMAERVLRFFGMGDGENLYGAAQAFRLYALSVFFTGVNTVITAFWQAVGRSRLAGVMSVARNLVVILAAGLLLIPRFGVVGLGAAYLFSEGVCLLFPLGVLLIASSRRYTETRFRPLKRVFEQTYVIRTESIGTISDDVTALCDTWEIAPKQAFFINLVLEELILNILKFGIQSGKRSRYLAIKMMDNDGEYIVRIRDNVRSYNPFESNGDAVDNAVIHMIQTKTKMYSYQRKLNFNYLMFIL